MDDRQVDAALERIHRLATLLFEVDIDGSRTCTMHSLRPLRNEQLRHLSILEFSLSPAVPTLFMPDIPGRFYITQDALRTGRATWLRPRRTILTVAGGNQPMDSQPVRFRSVNDHSRDWLTQRIAEAQGMRWREHRLLTPNGGEYVYRRDP